mmetsp:Transcript_52265/g.122354  ORF Transcript_52265/g.122354 Transcript_52265/m.122354 type:complete len:219 (+) Transcript_52265:86-742(+)
MTAALQDRPSSRLCRGVGRDRGNPFRSSQFEEDSVGTVRKTALRNQVQQGPPQEPRPELRYGRSFEEEEDSDSGTEIYDEEFKEWRNIRAQAPLAQAQSREASHRTRFDAPEEGHNLPRAGSRWAASQRTVIKTLTLRREGQEVKNISFAFDEGGAYVNEANVRAAILMGDRLLKINDVDVISLPAEDIKAVWREGAKGRGCIELLLAGPVPPPQLSG